MTAMLEAALEYAARGWACLPLHTPLPGGACDCPRGADCDSTGKHPRTERGLKDATRDEATIRRWWKTWPAANVGLAVPDGYVIIDVDGQEGVDALREGNYALPPTAIQATGNGCHYVYRTAQRLAPKVGLLPKVDLRGPGSYIVVAPSVHYSGVVYSWTIPMDEVSAAPAWLSGLVDRSKAQSAVAGSGGVDLQEVLSGIPEGRRDVEIFRAACKLRAVDLPIDLAIQIVREAAAKCAPPFNGDTAEQKVRAAYTTYPAGTHAGVTASSIEVQVGITNLADVEPEAVSWLWPGYIPRRKVTVIDGDPGLGKSTLTLDLAARVTTGATFPDGSRSDLDGPAGVVLLSAEDGLADTIRPRLDAAGADCTRVVALTTVTETTTRVSRSGDVSVKTVERLPTLADIGAIEQAIAQVGAQLVVVDPIMAYVGKADSSIDAEVRVLMVALAKLAEATGAAIVAVRHLNKTAGGNPLYRGGGSVGIIASARAGLLVAPDPDDPEKRVLAGTKANLGPMPVALGYRIEEASNGSARVAWLSPSDHTATTLLAQPTADEGGRASDAKDFLLDLLEPGPVAVKEIRQAANDAGLAFRTLERVKAELHIRAVKRGQPGEAGQGWVWQLPKSASVGGLGGVADFGGLREDLAAFGADGHKNGRVVPEDRQDTAEDRHNPEDRRRPPKAAKAANSTPVADFANGALLLCAAADCSEPVPAGRSLYCSAACNERDLPL